MAVSLRTRRLVLREWREEDAEPFAAMSADPAVMQYLVPFPDRAAMDAWVAAARTHWREHGFGQWVVEGEAPFIGVVGLSRVRFALPFAPAVEAAWRVLIGTMVMPMRPRAPRSMTVSAGSGSTKSSLLPSQRTGRRGGSWKSSA